MSIFRGVKIQPWFIVVGNAILVHILSGVLFTVVFFMLLLQPGITADALFLASIGVSVITPQLFIIHAMRRKRLIGEALTAPRSGMSKYTKIGIVALFAVMVQNMVSAFLGMSAIDQIARLAGFTGSPISSLIFR